MNDPLMQLVPFLSVAIVVTGGCTGCKTSAHAINCTHTYTDQTARIAVEGLERPVRVLHLTDIHLRYFDDRDAGQKDNVREEIFPISGEYQAGFYELMDRVPEMDLDLVAITGDAINWPSQANIEHLGGLIRKTGVPTMFVPGNHDWRYPQLAPTEELRSKWMPALDPLTGGQPECQVMEAGGIRFVGIDDSMYQITRKQLEFTRQQLATGQPVVMLLHIPISLPTLRPDAIKRWKVPIMLADPGWSDADRKIQGLEPDTPETLEFVRLLTTAPNLVAILSGHLHIFHADSVNRTAVQYVTTNSSIGHHRLVEFVPLRRD